MELVGREEQTATLLARLDEAAAGRGAAVTVLGESGTGVTSLVADAVRAAHERGLTVLTATGRATESHIDRSTLRELASNDASGGFGRALSGADGRDPGEVVLDSLAELASEHSVLIAVDDADRADAVSRSALAFAARRCRGLAAVLVFGSHTPTDLTDDVIELGPLDAGDLATVVSERHGLAAPVAERVAGAAAGVPLIALEIARSLTDGQRRGVDPLPLSLATHVSIPHAFREPMSVLPDDTRRALCVAAAEPLGEIRVISHALELLGDGFDAIHAAEEAGIVSVHQGRLRFDHPLRRNVAYHLLAAPSRRAAHRALAVALDQPCDAERRAAQLSLGSVEPDEAVAADLERVAEAAERRRDPIEASRWWMRAADLSPDGADAERRRSRATAAAGADTDADPLAGLTRAERRVADVVGRGTTNKQAAAELFVSVKTVDAHLQAIYRKLGIQSRGELAVLVTRTDMEGAR